mmetsp:Transcript_65300/g.156088  ORF Transcript_65300/g.156088 Transcript_65300/m.156088 type:complete len:373 (-) Transcript_65300:16-1134(-)
MGDGGGNHPASGNEPTAGCQEQSAKVDTVANGDSCEPSSREEAADADATAADLKLAGNAAYQRNEVEAAVQLWNRALAQYVVEIRPGNAASGMPTDESRQLEQSLYLNLAQGHLKLGEPKRALRACEVVVKDEPANVKALYRGVEALLTLKDYSTASTWLTKLQEVDPSSSDAKRLEARLRACQRDELKREKAAAKKMYSAAEGFSDYRPQARAQTEMPVNLERLHPENMVSSLNIAEEAAQAARARSQAAIDKKLPVPEVSDLDAFRAKILGKTQKYGAYVNRSQKARSVAERSVKLAWLRDGRDSSALDAFSAPLRDELQEIEKQAIAEQELEAADEAQASSLSAAEGTEKGQATSGCEVLPSGCMEMMD